MEESQQKQLEGRKRRRNTRAATTTTLSSAWSSRSRNSSNRFIAMMSRQGTQRQFAAIVFCWIVHRFFLTSSSKKTTPTTTSMANAFSTTTPHVLYTTSRYYHHGYSGYFATETFSPRQAQRKVSLLQSLKDGDTQNTGLLVKEDPNTNNSNNNSVTKSGDSSPNTRTTSSDNDDHDDSNSFFDNLALYEEKERKEMEWMVRTTSRFLWTTHPHSNSNSNSNTGGGGTIGKQQTAQPQPPPQETKPLTRAQCRRAHMLMKSWARRGATRPDSSRAPQVIERILQRLAREDEKLIVPIVVKQQDCNEKDKDKTATEAPRSEGKGSKLYRKKFPVVMTQTYNILLDAWSTSRQPGAAERCLDILAEMDRLVANDAEDKDHLRPDTTTFNACIKALVRTGYQQEQQQSSSVVDRVQGLIDEMKRRQKEQVKAKRVVVQVAPDRRSYNLLLYTLAHSPNSYFSSATVDRAMNILRHMWNEYHHYEEQELLHTTASCAHDDDDDDKATAAALKAASAAMWIKPNTNTYNQVIACVARGQESGRFEDQLQELLDEMITLSSSSKSSSSSSIRAVEDAHSHESNENEPLSSSSLDISTSLSPSTDTYNNVMGGWLKSRQPRRLSLGRILKTWNRMQQDYHEDGNESARPDRVTLNTLLTAYTKFGSMSRPTATFDKRTQNMNTTEDSALDETLRLWHSFQKKYGIAPDIYSFNLLLKVWAKSHRSDAPSQAEQILTFLERSLSDNAKDGRSVPESLTPLKKKKTKLDVPKPNSYSYATYIDCLIQHERRRRQQQNRPGDISEAEFQVAEQVDEVLRRMKALHHDLGGEFPNSSVYNSVINAWAVCALSKSSSTSSRAVKRCESLLREMQNDPLAPNPNRITYNTILKALKTGRTEDAIRAEQILNLLEQQQSTGDDDINDSGADSYSYTAVISSYARSDAADKAEKALNLLERLLDAHKRRTISDRRLSIHAFNAALNACAFAATRATKEEKLKTFSKAVDITKLMEEYKVQPDDTTHGTMLRATSTLLPNDERRQEVVESLFRKACQQGVCGTMVLKQLKFATKNPEQYSLRLGRDAMWVPPRGDAAVRDVPRAWSRNLRIGTGNRRQR